MAVISKTKKIESLSKILQKRCKSLPDPPERTVLSHLIYAALLENTLFEQADSAYTVLENYFIDWNEIRVSTANELADTFPMLPDPVAAGERVRRTLQGVFEKTYMFDLEELRKKGKNLGQAVDFLNSIPACTRFMVDYTTQVAFGGHVIPLDEASLRVFRLLDLTLVNKEGTRENVAGLERAIQKKNGLSFSLQIHHFAAGFYNDPELAELRSILKTIDPEAENRSWTPPVLTLPKPVVKQPVKPALPPLAVIPFGTPDDDDFDEEHGGTEAEFIPDETIYQHDLPVSSEKINGTATVTPSAEKKKTPKQEKTSVKKNAEQVPAPPNSSQPVPQPQEKQPKPVQETTETVTKKETDKKTTSKNNKTVTKPATKTDDKPNTKPETKSVAKPNTKPDGKSDISKNSHALSPPKQVAGNSDVSSSRSEKKSTEKKSEEKNNTKTVKSTIKQLVKKKPK
jgi:endonuclease-3